MSFERSVIIAELWRTEVERPGNLYSNVCVFLGKTILYVKTFKILLRKFSPPYQSTLFGSNFVKCCRREISEIMRYLLDQKKFRLLLKLLIYCADHAQNLPGPAPSNVLTVLQISSKSVHFRRSYSRTSEHRSFSP